MEQQQETEKRHPMISPLQKSPDSRILWVSQNAPESYEYGALEKEAAGDGEGEEKGQKGYTVEETHHPVELELHQTAEILCKLSDSPTVHLPSTSDPLTFLTDASRYTIRPVYPPTSFPSQSTVTYPSPYPTFFAQPYPRPLASTKTVTTATALTAIKLTTSISDEEWMALTSPEFIPALNTCGSPVVEEFLQMNLPPDTPAEDRQGWYEFLCEDGGNEDCWTKFLGNDSGTEFHHEWLDDMGYQGVYQTNL